ncbi:hypothetical protein [Lysobacter terrae]
MIDRPLRLLGICLILAVGAWAASKHWSPDSAESPAIATAGTSVLLPETGVRAGASVSTPDDAFSIRVERASGASARVIVSAKNGDIYRFDKAAAGSRLVVPAPHGIYHLDVLRIDGNVVYLTMIRRD